MKARTDSSITVKFVKITEGTSPLTYSVNVTGHGSLTAHKNCDDQESECTASNLSPGRPYDITVMSCITGTTPIICSDASNAATVKTLPKGRRIKIIYIAIVYLIASNRFAYVFAAPAKVVALPLTTGSIKVTITPSSDPTGVDHYITATVEDPSKTCGGEQCVLNGLEHAKKYTVVSRTCLAEPDACSDPVKDVTWTKPLRKQNSVDLISPNSLSYLITFSFR